MTEDTDKQSKLTDRQLQMLAMVATGASNREIADKLVLAVSTVANTLRAVYRKINVRNRVQAVKWLMKECGEV